MLSPVTRVSTVFTAVALGALVACAGPDSGMPTDPQLDHVPGEPAELHKVVVCKVGTDASFDVVATPSGGSPAASTANLTAGQCQEVATSPNTFTTVSVTEVANATTQLDSIVTLRYVLFAAPVKNKITGSSNATVGINGDIGYVMTFYNQTKGGGEGGGDQGCTPGFWRNHTNLWPAAYLTSDDFDATFGVNLFNPNITLGTAITAGGGGNNKLARHGTAALLSAAHGGVSYPYSVAQVIAMVQAGDVDPLVAANELGCPLSKD